MQSLATILAAGVVPEQASYDLSALNLSMVVLGVILILLDLKFKARRKSHWLFIIGLVIAAVGFALASYPVVVADSSVY